MNKHQIFLHLPKCGGTTFHSILERMYLPEETFNIKVIDGLKLNIDDFISLSIQERSKIKLLKGHMEFGLHEFFSETSEYITFLRNPLDRVISYYYYVRRTPSHFLRQKNLFNLETSISELVNEVKPGDLNNGQVRLISGIEDKPEFMLEKALENIDKHFSFVGTIEKFDESLILLQNIYGWTTPHYKIKNKTEGRPKLQEVDDSVIDAIKQSNAADIELYNRMDALLMNTLEKKNFLKEELFKLNTISRIHYIKDEFRTYIRSNFRANK